MCLGSLCDGSYIKLTKPRDVWTLKIFANSVLVFSIFSLFFFLLPLLSIERIGMSSLSQPMDSVDALIHILSISSRAAALSPAKTLGGMNSQASIIQPWLFVL
jgi:hypothetical protein